jgi:hypothetical protein
VRVHGEAESTCVRFEEGIDGPANKLFLFLREGEGIETGEAISS